MKQTPSQTNCPPRDDLHRLLGAQLPEAEAARLQEHLLDCAVCRQRWQQLQRETHTEQTPSVLHPVEDTRHGQPVQDSSAAPITWSSEIMLQGGARAPAQAKPLSTTQTSCSFSFLDPPRESGELGWLAHYRITGVLGEGGMGVVFDAFDTHLQRRVALKVLKPELAANLSFRERFLLEARAAAALPDEHIITIYQVGQENDVPFLAMKFLYGESLEQRLQRDGRLPTHEVLRIGREIALGLSAAHDRGLIHRDIKPANLWLETPPTEPSSRSATRLSCDSLDRVKILDFGLARPVHDARRLTATGLIVGTPQYLAPEQARGQAVDHRCDLFSLGIVLYRMVTGNLPFDGSDTLAQLTALAVADPQPIEEVVPEAPAELRGLIHQLLARDPAHRPPTARAVAEAFRALQKGETISATLSTGQVGKPNRQKGPAEKAEQRKGTRRRWLLASGLLSVGLLCGLLSWRGVRPAEAEKAVPGASKEPIRVGVLFSQRGPMANGGRPAHDAAQLAIEELNQQGGVLGRPIEAIMGDGKSDYRTFAKLAEQFITQEHVRVLFGTRASFNRKAVRPIVEQHDNLLIYPMQFEGLEDSPNIIYLGAAPNQQVIPAIDYFLDKQKKRRLFLVGSDHVFPHAANAILRDHLGNKHPEARIVGEHYLAFGSSAVQKIIGAIQETKPDLIVNTISGDSNSAFFRALHQAGVSADKTPVLSFSMGENDLLGLGDTGIGHYTAWSYFQSIDNAANHAFVRKFQARFGTFRVVSDPMETIYLGVHLWARAVQAAGTVETHAVVEAIKDCILRDVPEGDVRVDRDTHYAWRAMRVGCIQEDGRFHIVFNTVWALRPEPYPSTRPRAAWDRFLNELYTGWGQRWQAPPR